MAEIDVLKAQLVRPDAGTPWGLRLQGGAEYGQPLTIMRITPGSPAARIGLKTGDEVTEIGDRSTQSLTHTEAQEIIAQYGLSLILTVERKARGAIPVSPIVTPQEEQAPSMKSYQTYDFSGATPHPRRPPEYHPTAYDIQTVHGRPYDPPPTRPVPPPAPPQPQPATHTEHYGPPKPASPSYEPYYAEETDPYEGPAAQSRTFKMLQNLMENQEPYAGSGGLPPPRSADLERRMMEESARRQHGSPRVKVFMPQHYNCPIGMYSAANVMDTFQTTAQLQLDELERKQPEGMSGTQQAVWEAEHGEML